MNFRLQIVSLVMGMGLALSAQAQKEETHTYKVDGAHTAVIFGISHLGFSTTYGRFNDVQGQFVVNESKPEKSSVEIKIKADSIDTNNKDRDKHLRGPDFFDVKKYPEITFKSKAVKKLDASKYEVSGDLTMHGQTKPVTFTLTRNRTGQDPWGKTRTGMHATLKVKRSDFGLNYMQGENAVGDDVELILSAEGIRQ